MVDNSNVSRKAIVSSYQQIPRVSESVSFQISWGLALTVDCGHLIQMIVMIPSCIILLQDMLIYCEMDHSDRLFTSSQVCLLQSLRICTIQGNHLLCPVALLFTFLSPAGRLCSTSKQHLQTGPALISSQLLLQTFAWNFKRVSKPIGGEIMIFIAHEGDGRMVTCTFVGSLFSIRNSIP